MWFVYVLQCHDGSLYTGITNNLSKRVSDHNEGKGGAYTRSHLPAILIHSERKLSKSIALKREAEIKSWSRMEKIRKLHLPIKITRG